MAHLLEIVPKSLAFEPQLQVMGVDATDALFGSIVSALLSGAGAVLGLLQAKFGALSA